jgi:hypothetical protein
MATQRPARVAFLFALALAAGCRSVGWGPGEREDPHAARAVPREYEQVQDVRDVRDLRARNEAAFRAGSPGR